MEIIIMIAYFRFEVYFKMPDKLENSKFYIETFPLIAWVKMILILFLIPCLVWIFCKLDSKFLHQEKVTHIFDCSFHVMSALANQGKFY